MKSIDHRMMRWLLLPALVLLLNACSDSDDAPGDQKKERVQIELMPCAPSYIMEQQGGLTRSWSPPDEYVTYNQINSPFEGQKDLMNKSISIFFTEDNKEPLEGTFFYRNSDSSWQLSMDVTEGDYYLYGFIPKEDAASAQIKSYDGTVSSPHLTYSDGAVLTIEGLQTVTASDVCVLIGAKEGPSSESDATTDAESNTLRLRPGYFKTSIHDTQGSGKNYVFLLFDHIYAALRFKFKVDPTYDALRTIHLRKLELIAYKDDSQGSVNAKFNAKITLHKNDDGRTPIVGSVEFTAVESSTSVPPVPIFEGDETLLTNPPANSAFMGCFVPGDNTYFKLRSTYDVYDKNTSLNSKGNLIRQGCQAENTIDLRNWFGDNLTTTRGHSYSLTMTVLPTYLYVLSDPDLDNPTLKISN